MEEAGRAAAHKAGAAYQQAKGAASGVAEAAGERLEQASGVGRVGGREARGWSLAAAAAIAATALELCAT